MIVVQEIFVGLWALNKIFVLAGVLPKYFSSEWSVAQFRLIEGSPYIVAFGHQKNTVIILGLDGRSANETLPYDFCWSKFPWLACHYH